MVLEKDALLTFLNEKLCVDTTDLTDSEPLFSSGILDSFSMVDMLVFIESSIGKRLSPADISLDNFDTVERIIAFAGQVAEA